MDVHHAMNSDDLESEGKPVLDSPDTLQDLCIFYLMNNVDTLVTSLNDLNNVNNDSASIVPLLLGNKMLEYYFRCCLPNEDEQQYFDKFLEKSQLCDEISITRTYFLSAENVSKLVGACKALKKLHLTCFDADVFFSRKYDAQRLLLENSLPYLKQVSLSQKCEEENTLGLLNVLCGRDYDADVDDLVSKDDDTVDEEDIDVDKAKPEGDTEGNCVEKSEEVDTGKSGECIFRNLDEDDEDGTKNGGSYTADDNAIVSMEVNESEIRSDMVISDLKSFSYEQIYTSAHPNLQPCRYFGWFYNLMSRILNCNKHLQEFTLVTLISNPIEWFLSQPGLAQMKDLQTLCLSFQYLESYAAESDEIKMPKMPYTETFFENLPVLRQLRHLDISCNLPDPEYEEEPGFAYTEKDVELFREAIKELPHLKSLNISGTNLATIICHKDKGDELCLDHCMPGFEGRQFDFLGLYGTEACRHKFIPAYRVSGNASIGQLLEALRTLQHNLLIIPMVVEEINDWIKDHSVDSRTASSLIDGFISYLIRLGEWSGTHNEAERCEETSVLLALDSIKRLTSEDDVKRCMTIKRKRMLLEQILVVCHNVIIEGGWSASNKTQRNQIYLTSMALIIDLELQSIAVYSYRFKQFVQVLIGIFESPMEEGDTFALTLLHSVCRDNQEYRAVVGTTCELVKKLLKIMKDRLKNNSVGSVEKKAWDIMLTLTAEDLVNCESFVQNEGCEASTGYIQKYPEEKTLLRTITATLGNVSEYSSLVKYLMRPDLLTVVRQLLPYESDVDYDVSSCALDFLVLLASQEPDVWTVAEPSRDDVLEEIDNLIKKWDIRKPKVINRSFTAVLSQIDNYNTPVAQIWAAWQLCYWVIIEPFRYCCMLESENGMTKIETVLQHGGLEKDLVTVLEKIKSVTAEYKQR